jgi:hypothetical protein
VRIDFPGMFQDNQDKLVYLQKKFEKNQSIMRHKTIVLDLMNVFLNELFTDDLDDLGIILNHQSSSDLIVIEKNEWMQKPLADQL